MHELFRFHDEVSGDGLAAHSDGARLSLELTVEDRSATLVLTDRRAIHQLAGALAREFGSEVQ